MFLLVPAYPGCPRQTAVKWLLLVVVKYKIENLYHLKYTNHYIFDINCTNFNKICNLVCAIYKI